MDIAQLLAFAVKNKASDLHLSADMPPMVRIHGDMRRINVAAMTHKDVHAMVYDIMTDVQRKARGFPLAGRGVRSLGAMCTPGAT